MIEGTLDLTVQENYLDHFNAFERDGAGPDWVKKIRKTGFARFAEKGFPTTRDEDWRFTNVAPITELPFLPVHRLEHVPVRETLAKLPWAGIDSHTLVFVNGHFAPELSHVEEEGEGIVVSSLAEMMQNEHPALRQHLAQYARGNSNAFAALNTAFFQDGAFIYLARGKRPAKPVSLVHVSTAPDRGATAHPRHLVVAEDLAELTLLEGHFGLSDQSYVTNEVIEFVVGNQARVEHCKFQDEALSSFHLARLHARLGASCYFASHSIATGARLSRNTIDLTLGGEGIECVLNGLYISKQDQLMDHHMVVEHVAPNCDSHEYFNGILADNSRGVFHGRIYVHPEAQKTDAKQTNKNLLLSDNATIDTKPQLEIYADDVKCTHGATIGQINPEAVFYLRARGIPEEIAKRMLIHAFANEILERIQHEPAREELERIVWDRLEEHPRINTER